MGREAVLKIILFDNLLSSFSSIDIVRAVEILYFYINILLIKQ